MGCNGIRRAVGIALAAGMLSGAARGEDSAWVSLFNGKDLAGWTPYFQKLGLRNADSTYKVTAAKTLLIDIRIDFNTSGFGHLFYTGRKFSHYVVRAVYRFPSNGYGPNWGQGWNRQNNGLMLHSQDPATMNGKDFPNSIEVQLLGKENEQNGHLKSQGFKYGATANMCSPGTFVAWNGNANYTTHCTAAQYPASWKNTELPWEDKDGWSDVTVRILGDSLVQHFVHGAKVFEYTRLRLDNGTPLKDGYLALQAEGTTTEFRSVEVLDLVGCMDSTKAAFRSYFVKHDAAACRAVPIAARPPAASPAWRIRAGAGVVRVEGEGRFAVELLSPDGSLAGSSRGSGEVSVKAPRSGLHLVRVRGPAGARIFRAVLP